MRNFNASKCVECYCVEDVDHVIAEYARVEAESDQFFMQFPRLERDNVGVYNSVLPSLTSDEVQTLYKLVFQCRW